MLSNSNPNQKMRSSKMRFLAQTNQTRGLLKQIKLMDNLLTDIGQINKELEFTNELILKVEKMIQVA